MKAGEKPFLVNKILSENVEKIRVFAKKQPHQFDWTSLNTEPFQIETFNKQSLIKLWSTVKNESPCDE